ncbi:hypothetical protein KKG22_01150 [Patescibacteria group bacterium]|nr:hypothetical protein [Patescibacteria group bacterium]MBU1722042.1 hypothetical protein [Patescibacteria group bacterium]MBU1901512.1 hypothetical protein [Patescibacteria group bacterium]
MIKVLLEKIKKIINKDIPHVMMLPILGIAIFQLLLVYGPFTHYLTHTLGFSRTFLEYFEYLAVPITILFICLYSIQLINKDWLKKDLFILGYSITLIVVAILSLWNNGYIDTVYWILLPCWFFNFLIFIAFGAGIDRSNYNENKILSALKFIFVLLVVSIGFLMLTIYLPSKYIDFVGVSYADGSIIQYFFFSLVIMPVITGYSSCLMFGSKYKK